MLSKLLKIEKMPLSLIGLTIWMFFFSCKVLPKESSSVALTNCDSLLLFTSQHWRIATPGSLMSSPTFAGDSVFVNTLMQSFGKRQFDDCIYQLDTASLFKYFGRVNVIYKYCQYHLSGKYNKYTLIFQFDNNGYVNKYYFGRKID